MKTSLLVLFLLLSAVSTNAQVTINPGIKLAFTLGNESEFLIGYELSIVYNNVHDYHYQGYGLVLNVDKINGSRRLHFGLEYMNNFVGIDVGPTFYWQENGVMMGYSIIPFFGAGLLPYYNFTYIPKYGSIHEVGSYVKIPLPFIRN